MKIQSEASPFARRLRPDETLLWEGRPIVESYARYRYSPYLKAGIALAACLLVSWELTSFLHVTAWLGHEISAIVAAGLLFAVCHSKASHLLSEILRLRARMTWYALTDRRIMILIRSGQRQVNYDELHLTDLCLTLRDDGEDIGTILFGISGIFHDFAFRSISGAKTVCDSAIDARQRQQDEENRRNLPREDSKQPLLQRLEDGENILWTGKQLAVHGLFLALFGLGVATVVTTMVVPELAALYAHPSVPKTLQVVVLAVVGVFFAGLYFAAMQESINTFYALTDRRLLRLYRIGRCPRFAEVSLDQLHALGLEWMSFGIGTISFGCLAPREFFFRSLWGVEKVRQQIIRARKEALTAKRGMHKHAPESVSQ